MKNNIKKRLFEIKKTIEQEQVSQSEICFLTDHKQEIKELGDILLAQWSGMDEEEFFS